jgi:hypothetical protein
MGQAPPGRYLAQMQWQLAVAVRRWCDFVSYDPRLPHPMRLFERDDPMIEELEREAAGFLAEIDAGKNRDAKGGTASVFKLTQCPKGPSL